ncbi:heat shock factor protein 1-like [Corapipo altera]|uniref:heat shock factor protein 1-like n=1 Tax=Corapipo altera TaxID=415028 RepID=UPI000FD6A46F|nr:heat shock factor protein 1-like [Corapipo altera]
MSPLSIPGKQPVPCPPQPDPLAIPGKQLVHYTAQPLFLVDSSAVDVAGGELPIFFELGEGPFCPDGAEYPEEPPGSLLAGTEPRARDPGVS